VLLIRHNLLERVDNNLVDLLLLHNDNKLCLIIFNIPKIETCDDLNGKKFCYVIGILEKFWQ
jgi:hypothetical protein